MLTPDTERIIGYIGDRWPGWREKQSPAAIEDWTSELIRLPFERAREAVREHGRSSRYSPTIAEFLHAVAVVSSRTPAADGQAGAATYPRFSGWWIVGRRSAAEPWHGEPLLWVDAKSEEKKGPFAERIAQDWCKRQQQFYGGEWAPVQQTAGNEARNPALAWQMEDRLKAQAGATP